MSGFNNFINQCTSVNRLAKNLFDDSMKSQYRNVGARVEQIADKILFLSIDLSRSRELANEIAYTPIDTVAEPLTNLFEALDLMIQSKLAFSSELIKKESDSKILKDFDNVITATAKFIADIFVYFDDISGQALNQSISALKNLKNPRAVENNVKFYLEQLAKNSDGINSQAE
jgi:hypothetical protein